MKSICDDYREPSVCTGYTIGGVCDCNACLHDHHRLNKTEAVDHPAHYNAGKYEVIDVVDDWGLDFELGNVVKYIARARHKGHELEDLRKALWYLERAVSLKAAREDARHGA